MKWQLLLLVALYYIGLVSFIIGFFLTRNQIQFKYSEVAYNANLLRLKSAIINLGQNPVTKPHHNVVGTDTISDHPKRVFMFIIDALRYDMVLKFKNHSYSSSDLSYEYFPTISKLLHSKPNHSTIFKFRADPPTVTSQRIKGIHPLLVNC
jgi:hypothetical protein